MIVYKTTKTFPTAALAELIAATGTDVQINRFENALYHSNHVFSAWEEKRLIGVLSAIDDTMNVFVTFFLLDPQYASTDVPNTLFGLFDYQYSSHKKIVNTIHLKKFFNTYGYYADTSGMVKNELPEYDIISLREINRELKENDNT